MEVKKVLTGVLLVSLGAVTTPSYATLKVYDFTGEFLSATLSVPDDFDRSSIVGSLTYDTSALSSSTRRTDLKRYSNPITSFTFHNDSLSGSSEDGFIEIYNDRETLEGEKQDTFVADTRVYVGETSITSSGPSTTGTAVGGHELRFFRFFLDTQAGATADVVTSRNHDLDSLDLAPLDQWDQFTTFSAYYRDGSTGSAFNARWSLTSLSAADDVPVPAPAAVFLLGLGLFGLGFAHRRR